MKKMLSERIVNVLSWVILGLGAIFSAWCLYMALVGNKIPIR